jgi:hypothetical protein
LIARKEEMYKMYCGDRGWTKILKETNNEFGRKGNNRMQNSGVVVSDLDEETKSKQILRLVLIRA